MISVNIQACVKTAGWAHVKYAMGHSAVYVNVSVARWLANCASIAPVAIERLNTGRSSFFRAEAAEVILIEMPCESKIWRSPKYIMWLYGLFKHTFSTI